MLRINEGRGKWTHEQIFELAMARERWPLVVLFAHLRGTLHGGSFLGYGRYDLSVFSLAEQTDGVEVGRGRGVSDQAKGIYMPCTALKPSRYE